MINVNPPSNTKRLAKNTLLLYARTFLIMAISLFTSRVVLNTLGIEDYGIYNVIGGFVAMFSIAGGTLVTACQRFLTFELGKKDCSEPQKIFSVALTIHIGLAVVLFVLFESIGLWFLNSRMNIPSERLYAANWVFQCSVLAFLVNIISSPYNALIIAHEKMSAFAYISLMDAVLKLLIVYALYVSNFDKLIIYSILYLGIAILDRAIYSFYCRRFHESKFIIVRDKEPYKSITGFAGYTFLGSLASILSNQGVSLILNLFCGVTINAARGVAAQVQNSVIKFVNDFMTALNPQITKTYAFGDVEKSMQLVYRGARFSFYLLMLITLPIIARTQYILDIWLNIYPDYAIEFIRLTIVLSLVTLLSNPLTTEILAVGKLKVNAFAIGGIRMLNLPLCYIVLKFGYDPEYCYYILILMEVISLFVRLLILKSQIHINVSEYIREVLLNIAIVFAICSFANFALTRLMPVNFGGLVLLTLISILFSSFIICIMGLRRDEKDGLKVFLAKKLSKRE